MPSDPHVPFVDLTTPHLELEEQLVEKFRAAVRSAAFIGGAEVETFEREFAAYCGTRFCIGVANGTDAVRVALVAAGIGHGDAVITVSHTFIATVEAITQAGAETEFVDIDDRTYCMSPSALREYLSSAPRDPKTGRPIGRRTHTPIKAVIPVHLYGQVAEMEEILAIAAEYQLLVIEDACQAHGAEHLWSDGTWRKAGTFGTAAAFSFYPGKNLGACGEAGAVTTDDEEIARRIRMLREHGQSRKYFHELQGSNARLDAIQAAFLRVKLAQLDVWNAQRRAAASRYRELLSGAPEIVPPFESARSKAVYHLYVVRTADRDRLAAHLNSRGIVTGMHYPLPVHLQNCYRECGFAEVSLPVTERVASEILSLPMFPSLTFEQQQRVVSEIRAVTAEATCRAQAPEPVA